MGHEALVPIVFDFADDMLMFCRDPRGQVVGPGVKEEEVESYVASLMRWNGQAMYDSISQVSAWRGIPVTYIFANTDTFLPLAYQRSMVALLEDQDCVVDRYEISTGHCPNLTATDEVVESLTKERLFRAEALAV